MTLKYGKFIVIEGLEGVGKSTAVNTIVQLLQQFHIATLTTREPGGTSIGELLRTIIKDPDNKTTLDNRSELLLLYASRVQLIEEVIKPALKRGEWVIADRFELSTFAYQGGGRGFDQALLCQLSALCVEEIRPDLTIYLDLSPELGMQRAQLRGDFDRIEQQSIHFFHQVHKAYLQYVKEHPEVITIDASLPLTEVQAAIKMSIGRFIESLPHG